MQRRLVGHRHLLELAVPIVRAFAPLWRAAEGRGRRADQRLSSHRPRVDGSAGVEQGLAHGNRASRGGQMDRHQAVLVEKALRASQLADLKALLARRRRIAQALAKRLLAKDVAERHLDGSVQRYRHCWGPATTAVDGWAA